MWLHVMCLYPELIHSPLLGVFIPLPNALTLWGKVKRRCKTKWTALSAPKDQPVKVAQQADYLAFPGNLQVYVREHVVGRRTGNQCSLSATYVPTFKCVCSRSMFRFKVENYFSLFLKCSTIVNSLVNLTFWMSTLGMSFKGVRPVLVFPPPVSIHTFEIVRAFPLDPERPDSH